MKHGVAGCEIADAQLGAIGEVRHLVEAISIVLKRIVDGGGAAGDLLAILEDREARAERVDRLTLAFGRNAPRQLQDAAGVRKNEERQV